jgi:hypothetical protein
MRKKKKMGKFVVTHPLTDEQKAALESVIARLENILRELADLRKFHIKTDKLLADSGYYAYCPSFGISFSGENYESSQSAERLIEDVLDNAEGILKDGGWGLYVADVSDIDAGIARKKQELAELEKERLEMEKRDRPDE